MKIEYWVLSAEAPGLLIEAVRIHIADGWEPIGGVAVSVRTDRWTNERKGYEESETRETWAQAVIRRTDAVSGDANGG